MKAEEHASDIRVLKPILVSFVAVILITTFLSERTTATVPPDRKCLIIVSGNGGYSGNELSKASSFYEQLESTCNEADIFYLTDPTDPNSNGPANVTNINEAFLWLIHSSLPSYEIVIYISDHEKRVFNETYFLFDDGNISSITIDSWLDQIQCSEMTVILNGDRSGLAGPDLADPLRSVICSMEEDQEFDPDQFNITRSLKDPTADQNNDGIVDYIEAYTKEVEWLQGSGQDPVLYHEP